MVSLDPCLPAGLNVALSRCFPPLGAARRECAHVARPGAPALEEQRREVAAGIEPGRKVVLFDDDAMTGGTARAARELLEPACAVERFAALGGPGAGPVGGAGPGPRPRPRLDLVDCRDFLLGAREGGLVVWLPRWTAEEGRRRPGRRLFRVPYALPFVRPAHRASVPADGEVEFSRRVWELNARFFGRVGGLTVGGCGGRVCGAGAGVVRGRGGCGHGGVCGDDVGEAS